MQYRVQKPSLIVASPLSKPTEVTVLGVEFSTTPLLWELRREYLVLKIKGGMHWSGRGEQSYGKTYFQVCRILENRDTEWVCEEVIDFVARA